MDPWEGRATFDKRDDFSARNSRLYLVFFPPPSPSVYVQLGLLGLVYAGSAGGWLFPSSQGDSRELTQLSLPGALWTQLGQTGRLREKTIREDFFPNGLNCVENAQAELTSTSLLSRQFSRIYSGESHNSENSGIVPIPEKRLCLMTSRYICDRSSNDFVSLSFSSLLSSVERIQSFCNHCNSWFRFPTRKKKMLTIFLGRKSRFGS